MDQIPQRKGRRGKIQILFTLRCAFRRSIMAIFLQKCDSKRSVKIKISHTALAAYRIPFEITHANVGFRFEIIRKVRKKQCSLNNIVQNLPGVSVATDSIDFINYTADHMDRKQACNSCVFVSVINRLSLDSAFSIFKKK